MVMASFHFPKEGTLTTLFTLSATNTPATTMLTTFSFLAVLIASSVYLSSATSRPITNTDPVPTPWPHQFHSILFMNHTGTLEQIDLWYDWTNGRNFNIIQEQLGELTYDLEWNNHTSFVYTLDSTRKCRVVEVEVGILRPDWLDGANYLGQEYMDGFLCNVWEKVDFIWYYEDVETKRPVHWVFYTGYRAHVMTFEVGKVLEDPKWQAPVYCFDKETVIEKKRNNFLLDSMKSSNSGVVLSE